MRALAILILCSIACGRGGFDRVPDAEIDVIDVMPDAPPVLACAGSRFAIDPATTTLSATATMRGYDVFAVDAAGQVNGHTYNFAGDLLATGARDVRIAPDATGPLAPLAVGDNVLMVIPYGRPTTGTSLIALDAQLGTKRAAMTEGLSGTSGALARNASGAIALITQRLETAAASPWQVEAELISDDGGHVMGPYPVIDGAEHANSQMILPAKNSFLLSWASSSQVRAAVLDQQLVSNPPVTISPVTRAANAPRAAYLASADRYLFVWYEKISSVDYIWGSLRDADLVERGGGPIAISGTAAGMLPVVVAGLDDFLVVWQDSATDYHLGAARVSKNGEVTQPGIRSNGGAAIAWDLVVRFGQAALVWLETGASLNLRLDPICN